MLNLIKHQRPDIDKSYLYVKDPCKSKYQLVSSGKKVGIKKSKNPEALIYYSQTIDDVYENLDDYNPVQIVFDDMIEDMKANTKLNPIPHWIVFQRAKTQYFACFYFAILFRSIKIYIAKRHTLFHHENF